MTENVLKFIVVGIWVIGVIFAAIFSIMVSVHAFCEFQGFFAKLVVVLTSLAIWCNAINILKRM